MYYFQGLTFKSSKLDSRKDIDLQTLGNSEDTLFNESMTVHPVTVAEDFYKLHSYFTKVYCYIQIIFYLFKI